MASGFDVQSGVGYRSASGDPTPIPIVRVTATDRDGNEVTVEMLPVKARRVGLDMIAAGTMAVAETSIRAWARAKGQDGDEIIMWIRTGMDELLDSEGEAE
jgi:hypothetical protein